MTFAELLAIGWTPPADDLHDSTFAPDLSDPREVIRGTFTSDGREAGYERSAR